MEISRDLLEVKNLSKVFTRGLSFKQKGLLAVDNVNFNISLEKPISVCLAGESGSGKTTIARSILGFVKPTSGEILYQGKNIWKMSRQEWVTYRKDVQAVFQDPYGAFNPVHKIDRMLKMPIKRFNLSKSNKETDELISKALEVVGLRPEETLGRYPHQLSGGQRQRIMIARAFMQKPRIIVADEPLSMLDASVRAGILNLMLDLKKNLNLSFIYITHDLSTARYISDEIIILYRGCVMAKGPVDRVIDKPIHPYVQLLIESVPLPNPKDRWRGQVEFSKLEFSDQPMITKGCKFYDICDRKMNRCADKTPSLTEVGNGHQVACFLCE